MWSRSPAGSALLSMHGVSSALLRAHIGTSADALLVGALLAFLWTHRRTPTRGLRLAAWAATASYTFIVWHGVPRPFLDRGGFTLVAVLVAVVVLAILESSWAGVRFLEVTPLRLIGRISYGLYVWHLFIYAAVAVHTRQQPMFVRVGLAVALSFAAAIVSFVVVERPFLRLKSRLESPRAGVPVVAPLTSPSPVPA